MTPDEFQFYVFGSLLLLSVVLAVGTVFAGIGGLRKIERQPIDPLIKRERLIQSRRMVVASTISGGLQSQLWMLLWLAGLQERLPDGWPRVIVRKLNGLLTFPNDAKILSALLLGLLLLWIVTALMMDRRIRRWT